MDPIGDDLLRTIKTEIGYREGPGRQSKFGEWYSVNVVKDPQYRTAPWCGMFIAWAAEKAGVQQYVGQFAWTPSHGRWFETNGAWSRTPEPGALVFFDWSGGKDIGGIDHVGVVERVEGGTIHTIEGNVDRVWLKRKKRDQDKVVGYGLPRKVKEHLAGAVPGDDGAPGQVADRIEVRPALVRDAVALTEVPGAASPVPVETAVIAGLLTLVLGMTFVLSRRRPRVSAGRHRRRDGRRKAADAPIEAAGPRERTPARGTGPYETPARRTGPYERDSADGTGSRERVALARQTPPLDRSEGPAVPAHLYEAVRVTRPGWAHDPYRPGAPVAPREPARRAAARNPRRKAAQEPAQRSAPKPMPMPAPVPVPVPAGTVTTPLAEGPHEVEGARTAREARRAA
ncbi:CHAP domain-containing protein [Streptosporangium longisporum]|uniref:Peptidase C51 domain-containing protein n=1 Tax=Streptosporangium longisporum TaxID=46187 RepID=A0ABP6LJ15_9ACTN